MNTKLLVFFSTALYAVTTVVPAIPGATLVGTSAVTRAGVSITLSAGATCPDGGGCSTYAWTQVSGPTTLVWSTKSVASPVIRGTMAGQYIVQVSVTPATGSPAAGVLTFGAVATGPNKVMVLRPDQQRIVGDHLMFGAGAWPYMESERLRKANIRAPRSGEVGTLFVTNTGAYHPTWKSQPSRSGTVAQALETDGSAPWDVTGTGTTFRSTFVSTRTGMVTTNGSTVTLVSGDPFPSTRGGKIDIGGTKYPVTSTVNTLIPNTLTISSPPANITTPTTYSWDKGGSVTVSAGTTVTSETGDPFRWNVGESTQGDLTGETIIINGVSKILASVASNTSLTLTTSATNGTFDYSTTWRCAAVDGNYIVIRDTPSTGLQNFRAGRVTGCASNNALTYDGLYAPQYPATTAPTAYWRAGEEEISMWQNAGVGDQNYYDGYLATHLLSLSTRLDQHRNWAVMASENWRDNPMVAHGNNYGSPRDWGIVNLMLRGGDDPAMWTNLKPWLTANNTAVAVSTRPTDPREDGYRLLYSAIRRNERAQSGRHQ